MTPRQEQHLWFWAAVAVVLVQTCGGCGSIEAPPDGAPDTRAADVLTADTYRQPPDTRAADVLTADTYRQPPDTRAADVLTADTYRQPPDVRTSDVWALPSTCLVCEGNGLAFPSTDPYSDGLPCGSKAIAYQCSDCKKGTASRRECCTAVDCSKFEK